MSDRPHRVQAARQDPGGTYKADADGKVIHIQDGQPGSRTRRAAEAPAEAEAPSPARRPRAKKD